MDAYLRPLCIGVFVLAAAAAGRWLVRRRWPRNPEVCASLTWACGLLIAAELAYAAFGAWVANDPARFSDRLHNDVVGRLYMLASWLYSGVVALSVWALVRGAVALLDQPPERREGLTPDQLRALFPLVRTHTTLAGTEALVVTQLFSLRENAIAKEPGSSYFKPRRCVSRLGLTNGGQTPSSLPRM